MRRAILGIALSVSGLAGCAGPHATLPLVYVTWRSDPTTTMTIRWLSDDGGGRVTWGPAGGELAREAVGTHRPLPHTPHLVHTVELRDLEPGAEYRFRVEELSQEHTFRTMPADAEEPITFVVGGDVYQRSIDERLYERAARLDPMFVVIGGDIVYDEGDPSRVYRWERWLETWGRRMVASDGRLIPMLAAIGNHEVAGHYDQRAEKAPFFYSLFVEPNEPSYRVVDFAGYMSIVLLDSGHTQPIDGAQARWLEETLAERAALPHLFVAYHVPAYPSVRAYDGGVSPAIRKHWVPLFERHGVDAVFEHHDHAYKRTHPIKGGRVDETGVLYLGDGAWGVPPRSVHSAQRTWYLAWAQPINHFIATTIRGTQRTHRAVDMNGRVFDRYPPLRSVAAGSCTFPGSVGTCTDETPPDGRGEGGDDAAGPAGRPGVPGTRAAR